jgi:lipoate-protein ligase A
MKILNEDQFSEMMTDMSSLIAEIKDARQDFKKEVLIKELVSEFRKHMKNSSIFKALENESFELEENIIQLKGVKREFFECKRKSEIMIIIVGFSGILTGGLLVLAILKILGKI